MSATGTCNSHSASTDGRSAITSVKRRVLNPEHKHAPWRKQMAATGAAGRPGRLVQYVVVRSDLVHKLSWPLGAVIAQACHAATAAVHLHYADLDTQSYLAELDAMHKVVLAAPDEAALFGLSERLTQAGVGHKLWIEQPENVATCLAVKPHPKELLQPLLGDFKLFK
ncbi:putative peptidyl-tRNA hydrolase PTRHD1 [Syngnathoides biaculeatus]|uniref:putative peptidyl-tRNA hydrolase PTRHD1 n=1 Tax=Syngnathoides biaculeatus TaxID=300417 RepID=UPI002ADD4FBE|nr:putative peptidyl-tRNA hydrolase PTRHD1 [Syngnathoides biaculeatus]